MNRREFRSRSWVLRGPFPVRDEQAKDAPGSVGRRAAPSTDYQSLFEKWDQTSWVRSKKHHHHRLDPQLQYFSASAAALLQHPEVAAARPSVRRSVLIHHLYNYLEFTVWLELGPVNEVCELLRRDDFLPWLPAQMKSDAIKIYVDEGGHAEMSHALRSAVEKKTGIRSLRRPPSFLHALHRMVRREEPDLEALLKLFFVIISETLITGTLNKLPHDESVQPAVRELAADHASDEGRHHAYFRSVFEYVWPSLPLDVQTRIGRLLPDMILAFLMPDARELKDVLVQFPTEFPAPDRIVAETLDAARASVRASAAPTLKMLSVNGVFKTPVVRQAFENRGLRPR